MAVEASEDVVVVEEEVEVVVDAEVVLEVSREERLL